MYQIGWQPTLKNKKFRILCERLYYVHEPWTWERNSDLKRFGRIKEWMIYFDIYYKCIRERIEGMN